MIAGQIGEEVELPFHAPGDAPSLCCFRVTSTTEERNKVEGEACTTLLMTYPSY